MAAARKPALDPQFAAFTEMLSALPPMAQRTLEQVRTLPDLSIFGEPEAVAHIRDFTLPVQGAGVAARLYVPRDNPSALIVYYHGGGWVFAGIETHELPLRAFANMTGAAILSVGYRLAPEHPFPTALEDCYAALLWGAGHQGELMGAGKPLLVGGDSAGGNLAAAVALAARDRKGPKIGVQILFYPVIDPRGQWPSYEEHAHSPLLTSADMRWYWSQYVPDAAGLSNPLAAPCAAESHRDLPAAVVAISEYDPLRDEGAAYAKQLRAAGNDVTLLHYDTMPHGFFNFISLVDAAKAAVREVAECVRHAVAILSA